LLPEPDEVVVDDFVGVPGWGSRQGLQPQIKADGWGWFGQGRIGSGYQFVSNRGKGNEESKQRRGSRVEDRRKTNLSIQFGNILLQ
jgi:hypothetical protein